MMRIVAGIAAVACFTSSVQGADWEGLYEGTIGKAKVQALLLETETGAYSYGQKPYDLGLHFNADGPQVSFIESKIPQLSLEDIQGDRAGEITATWQLRFDGAGATGAWTSPKKPDAKPKAAPITLKLVKRLTDIGEGYQAHDAYHAFWARNLAFEDVEAGKTVNSFGVGTAADTVFKVRFPRLVSHPDATRLPRINALLTEEHRNAVVAQRACVQGARRFGESDDTGEMSYDVQFTVSYASPTLMSVVESGSAFCGGAHPYNYSTAHTYDLVALDRMNGDRYAVDLQTGHFGRVFNLEAAKDLAAFSAYLAGHWQAAAAKPGPDDEPECATFNPDSGTAVGQNLSLHFVPEGLAVTRTGYPHVMSVCIWQSYNPTIIPWADLKAFARADQGYFPELK